MLETLSWPLLSVFVPTFFMTSLSPGLCMTLALSLGVAVGVRRALWMMAGELLGVGLVAVAAVLGVAAIMLSWPGLFALFKFCGGLYLAWLGWRTWRAPVQWEVGQADGLRRSRSALAAQGFVTAAANPKGWAFCIALLPPFIEPGRALLPQLIVLVAIILIIELACLLLYAHGGQALGLWLTRSGHLRMLNRVTGTLLLGVGAWLALG